MNSSISIRNSVALDWKPFILRSKNLPFKPNCLRKNISPNCFSCYVEFSSLNLHLQAMQVARLKLHEFFLELISLFVLWFRGFVVYSIDGGSPSSSGSSSGNWKGWVLGLVISVILPFFTHKLGPFDLWKKKFDAGLQQIEDAVEEGEKVTEVVEKEAEKWLDRLPDGWFKDALTYIEHGAEKTAKFLSNVDGAIDQFQEEEEKIEKCIESGEKKSKDSEEEEDKK